MLIDPSSRMQRLNINHPFKTLLKPLVIISIFAKHGKGRLLFLGWVAPLTLSFLCNVSTLQGAPLYSIAIDPVKIFSGPNVKDAILQSIFVAGDIVILKQQGRWAYVSFTHKGEKVTGWIKKGLLQAQKPKKELQLTQVKAILNDIDSKAVAVAEDDNKFYVDHKYGAKVIAKDLSCVQAPKSNFISGCVANLDIEIKGPAAQASMVVSCKAEFDMQIENSKIKTIWEEKIIRTPLKKGVGAARLQLAIIPLLDKKVKQITMQSYLCRLEKQH